uniref:CUB domain-containing protein n=1 Tax=Panagrolaimus sp. ES5 TaxID=591445 RepID=A0AC34FX02_9BILA
MYDMSGNILSKNVGTDDSVFTVPTDIIDYDPNYWLYDVFAAFGHVSFIEWNNECSLDPIARKSIFEFTNETEVIYVGTNYESYFQNNKICKWKFAAPDEYGIKVVIDVFNISSKIELIIKNSTHIIENHRSAQLFHPYYNSDNYIEINLSNGDPTFFTDIEFRAYVSIVRKKFKQPEDSGCTITQNGDATNWASNIGYENDMYCKYELIIPPNTQVSLRIIYYCVETNTDYIKYTTDENETIILEKTDGLNFHNFENVSNKHVLFEYISDGSVQYLGFSLSFIETY